MKILISSDRDLYREEVEEMRAGVKDWLTDPDKPIAWINAGLHATLIRDDLTVERLCHHDREPIEVTA